MIIPPYFLPDRLRIRLLQLDLGIAATPPFPVVRSTNLFSVPSSGPCFCFPKRWYALEAIGKEWSERDRRGNLASHCHAGATRSLVLVELAILWKQGVE